MCEAGTEMLRMSQRTVLPSKDPEAPFALADPGVVSFRSSESSAAASNETGDGVVLDAEIDAEGDGVATREYWDVVVKKNLCRAYPSLVNEAVHIHIEIPVRLSTFEAFVPARYHHRDAISGDRVSMTRIASHNEISHRFQAPHFRARLRMSSSCNVSD